jgi:hypothetical protein
MSLISTPRTLQHPVQDVDDHCHVSENPKIGPVIAETTMEAQAMANVDRRPNCWEIH